jgi:hypothetical protein
MKRAVCLSVATCLILVLLGLASAQNHAITDEQMEARAVLESFLNAQASGDIEIIKESLGGELLEKRLRLLNNPNYGAFLRDVYKDASFKILNYTNLQNDSIQIDVKIDFNEQESRQMRFLLLKKSIPPDSAPKFRIYSQTELTKTLSN